MKTKRPISINNSLVHGICNCNCITCGVNKANYRGPKQYQSEAITKKIIERIREAASKNIYIKNLDNSGDGEPTLHPEFSKIMDLYGEMKSNWKSKSVPPPSISVVTNGQFLNKSEVVDALIRNNIKVKISFPTNQAEHYGQIMYCDPTRGQDALANIRKNISKIMDLVSDKKIPELEFHISPPFLKYVKPDFPETLEYLTKTASRNNLQEIRLAMFPAPTNRGGLVKSLFSNVEKYQAYFRKYNNKKLHNTKIKMFLSYKHFYPSYLDFLDVLSAYDQPCLWYAGNIFITPSGATCCCNDQNVLDPMGNVNEHSIDKIMELKERQLPSKVCATCNQTSIHMVKYGFFPIYHLLAHVKSKMNKRKRN